MSSPDPLGPEEPARRALDFAPLSRRAGLRPRLREAARNNLMVYSLTIGVLLTGVPLVIVAVLVATGNATDGGGIAFLLMLSVFGIVILVVMLHLLGATATLRAFASANDLDWVGGTTVEHYAASRFADGTSLVQQGVRTSDLPQLEVGDRYPITAPSRANDPNQLELYLRVRLDAVVVAPVGGSVEGSELLTPELASELETFAGRYAIEVERDEITLFGSRPLKVAERGRVEAAFALAEALAARAHEVYDLARPDPSGAGATPEQTTSGIPIPVAAPAAAASGPTMSPWKVVASVVAFLAISPFLIALVFSSVETMGEGGWVVGLLLGLVLIVLVGVVGAFVRKIVTPSAGAKPRRDQAR